MGKKRSNISYNDSEEIKEAISLLPHLMNKTRSEMIGFFVLIYALSIHNINNYFDLVYLIVRVYLDNCCFNRPFDDQSGIRVKLETDAKLYVQASIRSLKTELAWSYILDFENEANPFLERKYAIEKWKHLSVIDVEESGEVLKLAEQFVNKGIKGKDALHVACAVVADCAYFLTTDIIVLKKLNAVNEITVINPVDFVNKIEEL